MKVILLAGGLGTRISEYTNLIPKPMIPIGGKPIIWHIMQTYAYYGYKDFYLALGYLSEVIKNYFINYKILNSDITINLDTGEINYHKSNGVEWSVTMIETGVETLTGGRVKRMKNYVGNETFLLTYGDGVADININELIKFHKRHGKMITMTAVRPTARFGELELNGDIVNTFKEKPQMHEGWINGGYFVIEPSIFELIDGDNVMFEREPLEKVVNMGEMVAFRLDSFWQCMDTKRDMDYLECLWSENNAPWKR